MMMDAQQPIFLIVRSDYSFLNTKMTSLKGRVRNLNHKL
jgi:hypothetical protein